MFHVPFPWEEHVNIKYGEHLFSHATYGECGNDCGGEGGSVMCRQYINQGGDSLLGTNKTIDHCVHVLLLCLKYSRLLALESG